MNKPIKSSIILIDNILYEIKKFTRKSYAEKLEKEGLASSAATITKILTFIENELEIKIKFQRNGFAKIIESEIESVNFEKYHNYKNIFYRVNLQNTMLESKLSNQFISFGFETKNKNAEYIKPLLEAITLTQKVKFTYKSFQENTVKSYLINPLFLKEYLNRWYIIGETEKTENRVFAMDRILEIEFLIKKFTPKMLNYQNIYNDTIGVNFSGTKEKVVLWVSEKQYPYFETLPIHHSQKLIEKTDNGFIISLEVVINFELERWILFYGNKIKVIRPKAFRNKIVAELKETLKYY